MNNLPLFAYHPNPIATGSVISSEESCECCGKARGCVYWTTPYGKEEVEFVCPWCIADGTASAKLGVSFSDSWTLPQAGIAKEIIDEVTLRTPGYVSWQQESWIPCCNDACEFHGEADPRELAALGEEERFQVARDFDLSIDDLEEMLKHYEPKGSPAIYKFKCRHCETVHYNWDCA